METRGIIPITATLYTLHIHTNTPLLCDCRYELAAFISHMGSSSHSGHYVCHIKNKEGRWVIYNDNKVALSVTPPRELGYLYLYKRCD